MVWKIVCDWLYYIFGYYIFGWTVATENVITENEVYYIFGWYYIFGCDRARVAEFYGRLRLIRSVLRASKFYVLKLTEIVILWVYYTIPFGFSLIRHFLGISLQRLTYFVRLRITDEGSVPEMRIWSILLIKSDFKWCIHLSRSLFSYLCPET